MYVTGFLSLWIQNTAAASMMLPIVIALVKQLAKFNPAYSGQNIKLNQVHRKYKF
jgi:di/tricarboxylate transporter